MRILVADRNARLLESISRTFVRQFTIQTATSHEQCNELLLQCEFDLAVISEKLADGPGLKLLGQIARDSPDTLRVFAARRARLQLLKGKLGPFGLFRTLSYPIEPRDLLSTLALARSGLEVDAPALEARNDPAPEAPNVPAPPAASPAVERISLTSAEAVFAIDVPTTIASLGPVRRSNSSSAPRVAPVAPQASASRRQATAPQTRPTRHPAPVPTPAQSPPIRSAPPRWTPPRETFELIEEPRKTPNRVASWSSQRQSMRTKVALAATVVVVFLVTTLTLNLFDANMHVTRASTPRPEIARSDVPAPPPSPAPVLPTPAPSVAHRVDPRSVAANPDVEPANPQVAASTTPPVADPSTFGSEAYEPIYSN